MAAWCLAIQRSASALVDRSVIVTGVFALGRETSTSKAPSLRAMTLYVAPACGCGLTMAQQQRQLPGQLRLADATTRDSTPSRSGRKFTASAVASFPGRRGRHGTPQRDDHTRPAKGAAPAGVL